MQSRFGLLCLAAGLFLVSGMALGGSLDLAFIEYQGAIDKGPQDGIFDEFLVFPNGDQINNNGFSEIRGAMEFDLSPLSGEVVVETKLTLTILMFEGSRSFTVHGWPGNGTVELADFALDGLIETEILDPVGQIDLEFDVTDLVQSLLDGGRTFAGFNLREEPANGSNFVVMAVVLNVPELAPTLSVELSVCGDGSLDPGEECDDGNNVDGDGCASDRS